MRQHTASTVAAVASIAATMLAASPAVAGQDTSTLSKATLDYTVSSTTCTLTTPAGASNVPCSGLTLQPGWSATMSATWNWHYTDDGLPMAGAFLIGASGGARRVSHESAGLYVTSQPFCDFRTGCSTLPPNMTGDTGMVAVFESENNVPDDITGSRTLTLTATWPTAYVGTWSGSMGYLAIPGPFVNSVPEPSTWALFGVSLAALAFVRRRHIAAE